MGTTDPKNKVDGYIADVTSSHQPTFMKSKLLFRQAILLSVIVAVLLFFCSCSSSKSFKSWDLDDVTTSKIDSLCARHIAQGHFPGLVVAVVDGKKNIWTSGYGYANLEKKLPVDPADHLFRIGSISKTVTASGLARLYERGEINLDLPISTYYKECPDPLRNLTLRQVSGHLAGIRHYRGLEFMSNIHYNNVTEPLEVFIHDTLLCLPGEKFNYSTYAWTLVSAVMEKSIRKPFTAIIADEVSKPLQMTDLKPDAKDSTGFSRVTFYEYRDSIHQVSPVVDNSNKWAGGGYLCSAEDLAKLGWALAASRYLKEDTMLEFTRSQTTNDGTITNNGIGFWSGKDDKERSWVGHSGGSVGGTSMLLIYPEQDLAIVTLINLSSAQMDGLAQKIADIILSTAAKK
jgi:serine beta-lactamase-like protein LACTB